MKNKKVLIIVLALVFVGITTLVITTLYPKQKRVSGSVSDIYNGASITCAKESLEKNEETTCTLKLNTGSYPVTSFQGKIASSSNLTLSNIQVNQTDWVLLGEASFNIALVRVTPLALNTTVDIASFKVTAGSSTGTGSINLEKLNGQLSIGYEDGTYGSTLNLEEISKSVSITETVTPASSDASLKTLKVNGTSVLNNLSITVDNNVTSATIVAEANHSGATVTIDGNGTVELNEGNNSVNVTVVAENQTTTQVYTIVITRRPSQSEQMDVLTSLSISPGSLNETFDPSTNNYTATVPNNVDSITISATAGNSSSTVPLQESYPLSVGLNTITITVTTPSNVVNTYTLKITREGETTPKSNDATIKSVKVDGMDVDLNTLTTTVEYENNDFVTIEVTPNNSKAKVTGKIGSQLAVVGENSYDITVTAEDGTTKNEITLIVVRKEQDSKSDDSKITCTLSSSKYNIDNTNLKVTGVSLDDNENTIKNNIKASCGTITVSNEKVILTTESGTVTYLIERVWFAKTGNEVVKYWIIFGIGIVLVGIGIGIKVVLNKKQK